MTAERILPWRAAAWAALIMVATSAVVFGLGPIAAMRAASPGGVLLDMQPRDAATALVGLGSWISRAVG